MGSFEGEIALVLNAHFPYVRRAGRWPHGEEALHEVIAESYLPLLNLLHDLRASGDLIPLSISVSPILLEQLGDPVINKHFALWLDDHCARAQGALERAEASGDGHLAYLAQFYLDLCELAAGAFEKRYARNVAHGLRDLISAQVELLLAPATAAYLPHLDEGALRAQIQTGALATLQTLHRRPRGLWLPYGGYHPGLLKQLDTLGIRYVVAPPGAEPGLRHVEGSQTLVVRGDREVTQHVLAPGLGYPGDSIYREFYRTDDVSGLHFWRVTGVDVPIEHKALYDPYPAFERAEGHAQHWLTVLHERLRELIRRGQPPLVVVALDAELFGHWWFEGITWLRSVLREIHAAPGLHAVTLGDAVQRWSDSCVAWQPRGANGAESKVAGLWQTLDAANRRMGQAARTFEDAEGTTEQLLAQAAREVLLASSGDWFALIANESAADYARKRFAEHLARFEHLLAYAERPNPSPDAQSYLAQIAELDNPFQNLNYRIWS